MPGSDEHLTLTLAITLSHTTRKSTDSEKTVLWIFLQKKIKKHLHFGKKGVILMWLVKNSRK